MRAHTKASLLWGVIAALVFLVLAQGYNLLGSEQIDPGMMVSVAILAGGVTSVFAYYLTGERELIAFS